MKKFLSAVMSSLRPAAAVLAPTDALPNDADLPILEPRKRLLHPAEAEVVRRALRDPKSWTEISGSCLADFAYWLCKSPHSIGEYEDYVPERSIRFRLTARARSEFRSPADIRSA